MVNVTHNRHHRGTVGLEAFTIIVTIRENFLLQRVIAYDNRFMSHLFDHKRCSFLIKNLVNRNHFTHFHHGLDHFTCFHRHAVR